MTSGRDRFHRNKIMVMQVSFMNIKKRILPKMSAGSHFLNINALNNKRHHKFCHDFSFLYCLMIREINIDEKSSKHQYLKKKTMYIYITKTWKLFTLVQMFLLSHFRYCFFGPSSVICQLGKSSENFELNSYISVWNLLIGVVNKTLYWGYNISTAHTSS